MKAHERAGFNYLGEQDNDRLSAQSLTDEEIMEHVCKIIHGVEEKPQIPRELSAIVRPSKVSPSYKSSIFSSSCI